MANAHFSRHTLMYDAIDRMAEDHNRLWQVLDILEQCRSQFNKPGVFPDAERLNSALDYLAFYCRHIHQKGDGDILLHRLLRERVSEAEALLCSETMDQIVSTAYIDELKSRLLEAVHQYPQGRGAFSEQLGGLIAAFRKYIRREEGVVIPLAREHLQAEDWARLVYGRDTPEDPLFGKEPDPAFAGLRRSLKGLSYGTGSSLASGLQAMFSHSGRQHLQ